MPEVRLNSTGTLSHYKSHISCCVEKKRKDMDNIHQLFPEKQNLPQLFKEKKSTRRDIHKIPEWPDAHRA